MILQAAARFKHHCLKNDHSIAKTQGWFEELVAVALRVALVLPLLLHDAKDGDAVESAQAIVAKSHSWHTEQARMDFQVVQLSRTHPATYRSA